MHYLILQIYFKREVKFTFTSFTYNWIFLQATISSLYFLFFSSQCELIFNNDRTLSYNCVYIPSVEGQYKVTIKYGGKDTPKCPYLVTVAGKGGDATKVIAQGPGVEKTGVVVNRKTYFEVITKGTSIQNSELLRCLLGHLFMLFDRFYSRYSTHLFQANCTSAIQLDILHAYRYRFSLESSEPVSFAISSRLVFCGSDGHFGLHRVINQTFSHSSHFQFF